jgi:FAD linked oxidases, C-terminal domain
MMNCAPDVAKSSPLIAVRPGLRYWSLACHAIVPRPRDDGESLLHSAFSFPISASQFFQEMFRSDPILFPWLRSSNSSLRASSSELAASPLSFRSDPIPYPGEHGIGLAKKRWWPDATTNVVRELLRKLKHAFDPHGILNPGKFVD